ncbi:hypothetical protein Dimus_018142 [Dionaea muscipula]
MQESQAVAKKTKPLTKTRKKSTQSPAVGENVVETTKEDAIAADDEDEEDSDLTESDEAVGEDTQTMETSVVPVVNEEGHKKRRYKAATLTRPKVKKPRVARLPRAKNKREEYLLSASGAPADLARAVPADVPDRRVMLDVFGPTTAELEQRGLDGGMSTIFKETQAAEVEAEEVVDEEREGEMVEYEERGYEIKGDGPPSTARRPKGAKSRETLFIRGRLWNPSTRMVNKYMETMMGTSTRATRAAI